MTTSIEFSQLERFRILITYKELLNFLYFIDGINNCDLAKIKNLITKNIRDKYY